MACHTQKNAQDSAKILGYAWWTYIWWQLTTGQLNSHLPSCPESFLYDISEGHASITMCQPMAIANIYWPNIDNDTEAYIKQCPTCIRLLPTLPAESLINHNIPWGQWQKLCTDFMDWDGKRFLFLVDYFFIYAFLFHMTSSTDNAVINHLTELFLLIETPRKCSLVLSSPSAPKNGNLSLKNLALNWQLQAFIFPKSPDH